MHTSASTVSSGGSFAPTRWTLVLRAERGAAESTAALSELCTAYYAPVIRFLERNLRDADAAQEVAHEFFAALLARGGFHGADPARGRFRSYVLGALKHFMLDRAERAHRLKRGAGTPHEALHQIPETEGALGGAAQVSDDDARFDREWAINAMNRAMAQLEAEQTAERAAQFATLRPCLTDALDLPKTALALGTSEGALKVAAHRLRRRFRELLKAEVRQTILSTEELQDELRHLCAALGETV